MISNWRRPGGAASVSPPKLSPETGAVLALNITEVTRSAGCLMGQIAGLGQVLAERLAAGDLAASEATAANERMVSLIQAVESVCEDRVGPLRERLAPSRVEEHTHA